MSVTQQLYLYFICFIVVLVIWFSTKRLNHTSIIIIANVLSNDRYYVERQSSQFRTEEERHSYFKKYWVLQRQMRSSFEKMIAPCQSNMTYLSYNPYKNPETITSIAYSRVLLDVQPAGQYNRLIINTYNLLRERKHVGGDTWRVRIYGRTSVPATVIDKNDGSYEIVFLIVEPGTYSVSLHLDYTFCDGMKDPPSNWFVAGNAQGKYQAPSLLPGNEKPFLEQIFKGNLTFTVQEDFELTYEEHRQMLTTPPESCYMLDGFGRWLNDREWKPYVETALQTRIHHTMGKGILWILGDSVGNFFYKSILRRPLCTKIFASCNSSYYWIYDIPEGNLTIAKTQNDNLDFSIERIIKELKQVLQQLDSNSALLLNYGLHYTMDISFRSFQHMIQRIVDLIRTEKKIKIIWKTTTALYKWRWGCPNTNARHAVPERFLTTARAELFNAYSTSQMCQAGIPVLDVYPMSLSYPNGTRNLCDAVHFNNIVFKPAEDYLEHYFHNKTETPP